MSKRFNDEIVSVTQLETFKAEDYLNSRASINAFMADIFKSGDARLIAMAERTIEKAKAKKK